MDVLVQLTKRCLGGQDLTPEQERWVIDNLSEESTYSADEYLEIQRSFDRITAENRIVLQRRSGERR